MEKRYWITGIVLVVLAVAGILIFDGQQATQDNQQVNQQNKQIVQKCTKQGSFCIYNNIPPYLKYTSPTEEIPRSLITKGQEDLSQYFKRTGPDFKEINEAFGLDTEKWICKNGDEIYEVKYFYDTCDGVKGLGCGYRRKAFVCGNMYFIEQYLDSTGPVLYGPFSIEN